MCTPRRRRTETRTYRPRGIPETEAERMIITGFVDPIVKALPFEYAIELNKLIDLEIS